MSKATQQVFDQLDELAGEMHRANTVLALALLGAQQTPLSSDELEALSEQASIAMGKAKALHEAVKKCASRT